jgi:hypothetical protein
MADEDSKRCTKCAVVKLLSEFPKLNQMGGFKPRCKPCHNEDNKEYRKRNPETAAASSSNWAKRNKDKVRAKSRRWVERNPEKPSASAKAWRLRNPEATKERDRLANSKRNKQVKFRIRKSVSEGIRLSLRSGGKLGRKTFELLGYTHQDLMSHLERQFIDGMTWDNYGDWHIDHIVALADFKYESAEDQDFKAAWCLSNLRPLWASDNCKKKASRVFLL